MTLIKNILSITDLSRRRSLADGSMKVCHQPILLCFFNNNSYKIVHLDVREDVICGYNCRKETSVKRSVCLHFVNSYDTF